MQTEPEAKPFDPADYGGYSADQLAFAFMTQGAAPADPIEATLLQIETRLASIEARLTALENRDE